MLARIAALAGVNNFFRPKVLIVARHRINPDNGGGTSHWPIMLQPQH